MNIKTFSLPAARSLSCVSFRRPTCTGHRAGLLALAFKRTRLCRHHLSGCGMKSHQQSNCRTPEVPELNCLCFPTPVSFTGRKVDQVVARLSGLPLRLPGACGSCALCLSKPRASQQCVPSCLRCWRHSSVVLASSAVCARAVCKASRVLFLLLLHFTRIVFFFFWIRSSSASASGCHG